MISEEATMSCLGLVAVEAASAAIVCTLALINKLEDHEDYENRRMQINKEALTTHALACVMQNQVCRDRHHNMTQLKEATIVVLVAPRK